MFKKLFEKLFKKKKLNKSQEFEEFKKKKDLELELEPKKSQNLQELKQKEELKQKIDNNTRELFFEIFEDVKNEKQQAEIKRRIEEERIQKIIEDKKKREQKKTEIYEMNCNKLLYEIQELEKNHEKKQYRKLIKNKLTSLNIEKLESDILENINSKILEELKNQRELYKTQEKIYKEQFINIIKMNYILNNKCLYNPYYCENCNKSRILSLEQLLSENVNCDKCIQRSIKITEENIKQNKFFLSYGTEIIKKKEELWILEYNYNKSRSNINNN
jgi:hypothetical protein